MAAEPTTIRQDRLMSMLAHALGPRVGALLADDTVEEVRANPDGVLWIVQGGRRVNTGHVVDEASRRRVILLVADHVKVSVDESNPSFPAELPGTGYRFHAVMPPQSPDGPTFVIRRKAGRVFPLASYVERGAMTQAQHDAIAAAVARCDNILVVGGTASGKTTLANAILQRIGKCTGRVLTIEDTLELQVEADEVLRLRTVRRGGETHRTMADLVRDALRLTPDRVIVGEVRGAEVNDMLNAWNTGHPGGLATIHANSAREALERIEDMLVEGGFGVVPRRIARSINLIVFVGFDAEEVDGQVRSVRRVKDLLRVEGVKATDVGHTYVFSPVA